MTNYKDESIRELRDEALRALASGDTLLARQHLVNMNLYFDEVPSPLAPPRRAQAV